MIRKPSLQFAVIPALALFAASYPAATALAVVPAEGYRLELLFDSGENLRGPEVVDVMGENLIFYEASHGLEIADPATETIVASYGVPTDGYMVEDEYGFIPWVSFVEAEPGGDAVWVGFTILGNADDRIYRLDLDDGTWTHKATMPGNFDLEFFGNDPYISGLNDPDWDTPNSIWKLDVSGANQHDQLIEIGGNSSGFGLTYAGDVYCASLSLQGQEKLWRWDATAIAGAVGEGTLTLAEGTLLYDIELGGYDTEMDDVQNAVFSGNETGRGNICVWPATNAPGDEPLEIASSTGETWLSFLAVRGDIMTDGTAYFVDYYTPGLYALIGENGSGSLAGDLNGDGSVNSADLDIVRANWGQTVSDPSGGDFNGDGIVNSGDLDAVRANWGAVAAASVPEPGVLVLLVLGVVGGVWRGGRRGSE